MRLDVAVSPLTWPCLWITYPTTDLGSFLQFGWVRDTNLLQKSWVIERYAKSAYGESVILRAIRRVSKRAACSHDPKGGCRNGPSRAGRHRGILRGVRAPSAPVDCRGTLTAGAHKTFLKRKSSDGADCSLCKLPFGGRVGRLRWAVRDATTPYRGWPSRR